MKKFIIITSIYDPTEAIVKFSKINKWQLIVVGDKKTPRNWKCESVIYLSPEDQEKMGFGVAKLLPWNHYTRKMIGYLYAIKNGADIIADSDDDNIPLDSWGEDLVFKGGFKTIKNDDYVNVYKLFTNKLVWPRGFPLPKILNEKKSVISSEKSKIGVWQYLADKEPDVDAIYRLVNNKKVYFSGKDKFILGKGTICPFNSQNTFFRKEVFPLLYLPAFVSFRFTDILRGLVAQPILWNAGYQLGFGPATVTQERNPHDFMKDFESEMSMYLNTEKVALLAKKAINSTASVSENLIYVYELLYKNDIIKKDELLLVRNWTRDISKLIEI